MDHPEKDAINNLIEHVEEYLKTKEEYSKLLAIEKGSKALSAAFSGLIIFIAFFSFFVFTSLFAAYYLSEYFGKTHIGFGIIALFYFIAGIILYLSRDQLLKTPIMNSMIRNMLKSKQDGED